ncbi:MAG: glycogen debranching N-terminal domain-containing protein, partial [Candidatus Angelobacter sp.]
MATSQDGFVFKHKKHGLWVYQSRMLSRYRWLVNGKPPQMAANSNLHQHSWLGYYIASPANAKNTGFDEKNPAQQTIELRLSRQVGPGMHEDVDVTNFSRFSTSIRLELEVESDFADPKENGWRRQKGGLRSDWRSAIDSEAELTFDYRAAHKYDHQGNQGIAHLHRGIRLLLHYAGSRPRYSGKKIRFKLHLDPGENWHA